MATNYKSLLQQAITQYANDGIGLYNKLKEIHNSARQANENITYPYGETFNITIQNNQDPIPLSPNTDFNYCKFVVKNTSKIINLFSLAADEDDVHSVTIDKSLLRKDAIIYGSNQEMSITPKLLIVEDQNEWTYRNDSDPFIRKDVLFVTGNQIQNDPIATYNNSASSPACEYVDVSTVQKTIENIVFERTSDSTFVTNLLSTKKQYNVLIRNVTIITQTPNGTPFYEDECININDSAMIEMRNININRTYSAEDHWGYGIRLLNVWNSSILNLTAFNPEKGVMGNENVNGLIVENSDLNRVDVHCYGRDITCTNCLFRNESNVTHRYNRVSSFYGKLTFINCTFNSFLPLRIDSDYNAFTPFDLILDNCTLNVSPTQKSIVNTEKLGKANTTTRQELEERCLPNIIITNLHLNFLQATEFYFIRIYGFDEENDYSGSIHYMNTFVVDVVEVTQTSPNPVTIYDFCYTDQVHINRPLNLVEPLRRNINMIRHIVGGS